MIYTIHNTLWYYIYYIYIMHNYIYSIIIYNIHMYNIHNINMLLYAAAAELLQSCPTLCDPIDGGP